MLTSFVGRRSELADARAAMADSRLVTLTGPGGVGKTRVATELADRARRAFRDGVWTVELAGLDRATSRSTLEATIVEALAIGDQSNRSTTAKLREHLRDRHLLLVVDNCEHLLEATAAVVADVLSHAPSLRVLATSREPLGIAGEQVRRIPPLSVPPAGMPDCPEALLRFDSVALLVDRARAVDPSLQLTADNSSAVGALCRRLDGIPLAIELAATRLRSLSVSQVVERLGQRFSILNTGDRTALPRQQTLRALIDWSADLCSDAERLLWARLSVFSGDFDLRAAESICGGSPLESADVLDVLDRLVAKSIVGVTRRGELIRYRLLTIVREYGSELLDELGGRHVLKRSHRDHYLDRTRSIVCAWAGPGQSGALAEMRREYANYIAALEFCAQVEGEADAGLELASMLRYNWLPGGSLAAGRRWLERFLAMTEGDTAPRGDASWVVAWICLIQGDKEAAADHLRRCAAIATSLDDGRLDAHVAHWSGLLAVFSGDPQAAVTLLDRASRLHTVAGDAAAANIATFMLSFALAFDGQLDEALEQSRRGIALAATVEDRWSATYLHWTTAVCLLKRGELREAEHEAHTSLRTQRELGEPVCTALSTETLAWIAAAGGDLDRAAELAIAARNLMHGMGTSTEAFGPQLNAVATACTAAYEVQVSPERLGELKIRFANPSRDETLDLALGTGPAAAGSSAPDVPGGADHEGLTKREYEIAALVADGLSNREVAEKLTISPRTVDNHVARILAKLNATSRTQIATWMQATPGLARRG